MTPVQKFWKDLEAYGYYKDSQFILNVPLKLLEEIFDKGQQFYYETNSVKPNLSQIEISDEEIEEAAPLGNPTLEEGFIRGAKWYREQLKTKSCS
jgi:hypothetical protein